MQQTTSRFRTFAATVASETSEEGFRLFTDMGVSQVHPIGRHGRYWVTGYLYRHAFEALLSPTHATRPETELGRSHITKIWVRQLTGDMIVAAFDERWILRPTTTKAEEVIDYLASCLSFTCYGPLP